MTRKDYILLAEALRVQRHNIAIDVIDAQDFKTEAQYRYSQGFNDGGLQAVVNAASEIADALKRDSARFDKEHFLAVVRGERELTSRPPRRKAVTA